MVLQSELNEDALNGTIDKLASMRHFSLLGSDIVIDKSLVIPFAKELFNLIPGELMTSEPFLKMQTQKGSQASLRTFPAFSGGFGDWPFTEGACGVTAIVGQTGSRKSELIASAFQPEVTIRFNEPYEKFDTSGSALHPMDLEELLCILVVLCSQRIPTAIDSLRKLAFELDGAAGSQGVIAKLFTVITDLNNLCSMLEMNVPVVLNPMVKGDEALEHVYSNMAGAVSGAILIKNGVVTASLIRRKNGRSGIESKDFIAKAQSEICFAINDETEDVKRESLSRAPLTSKDEPVTFDQVEPKSTNADRSKEDINHFDDMRSGSAINLSVTDEL